MRNAYTYEGWNEKGYYINRGEKAQYFTSDHKPIFFRSQVHKAKISVPAVSADKKRADWEHGPGTIYMGLWDFLGI